MTHKRQRDAEIKQQVTNTAEKHNFAVNEEKSRNPFTSFIFVVTPWFPYFIFMQSFLSKLVTKGLLSKNRKCCKCSRPKRVFMHLCLLAQ
jgi:hypothetical protein